MTNRQITILIAILLIGPMLLYIWTSYHEDKYKVVIAAGQQTSQAYIIAKSIGDAVHRNYPNISVEVAETRGSMQNADLIEKDLVELATVQAEKLNGSNARLIATLYPDTYQLIVRPDSNIKRFEDLVGKKIALPSKGGGEYEGFWSIANYFGIRSSDVKLYVGSDKTTDWIFENGQVDAIFRVRAPSDASITRLVKSTNAKFIDIEQAEAIRLNFPQRQLGFIPKGSYSGFPPVPDHDVPSIAANHLLIANKNVPVYVTEKFAAVIFDKRQELISEVPLAGLISQPKETDDHLIPIHEGVINFLNREKPSFLREHSEEIATMVSVLIVCVSGYMSWVASRRRKVMHGFNKRLMTLGQQAKTIGSREDFDKYSDLLDDFLNELIEATEDGVISSTDYTTLNFTFEIVHSALMERGSYYLKSER